MRIDRYLDELYLSEMEKTAGLEQRLEQLPLEELRELALGKEKTALLGTISGTVAGRIAGGGKDETYKSSAGRGFLGGLTGSALGGGLGWIVGRNPAIAGLGGLVGGTAGGYLAGRTARLDPHERAAHLKGRQLIEAASGRKEKKQAEKDAKQLILEAKRQHALKGRQKTAGLARPEQPSAREIISGRGPAAREARDKLRKKLREGCPDTKTKQASAAMSLAQRTLEYMQEFRQ